MSGGPNSRPHSQGQRPVLSTVYWDPTRPSRTADPGELPSAAPGTGQEVQLPILSFLQLYRSVWGWGWNPEVAVRDWAALGFLSTKSMLQGAGSVGPQGHLDTGTGSRPSWLIKVWADELGDLRPAVCPADKQLFCPPASWLPEHVAQKSSNHQRGRTATISQASLNVQRRGHSWWPSG